MGVFFIVVVIGTVYNVTGPVTMGSCYHGNCTAILFDNDNVAKERRSWRLEKALTDLIATVVVTGYACSLVTMEVCRHRNLTRKWRMIWPGWFKNRSRMRNRFYISVEMFICKGSLW